MTLRFIAVGRRRGVNVMTDWRPVSSMCLYSGMMVTWRETWLDVDGVCIFTPVVDVTWAITRNVAAVTCVAVNGKNRRAY